jgi:hypothetical protein
MGKELTHKEIVLIITSSIIGAFTSKFLDMIIFPNVNQILSLNFFVIIAVFLISTLWFAFTVIFIYLLWKFLNSPIFQ